MSTIGMDLPYITERLRSLGACVVVKSFREVDLKESFAGWYVLYQSSEDRDLLYKDYIEDIILGIENMGGTLVPRFQLFRAHHNKLFFEIIRSQSNLKSLISCASIFFGTLEDLSVSQIGKWSYPKVIKSSAGCRSKQVRLAKNHKELLSHAKSLSSSFNLFDFGRFLGKKLLRKGYIPESLNRRKFIVQDFVPGLSFDYKVLVYGNRYYVLKRQVRKNDFRASGSGLFSFPIEAPVSILNCSKEIFDYFNVPYISLDLAETEAGVIAIEVQFLMFGTYTQEAAKWWFEYSGRDWIRRDGNVYLENAFCDSIVKYMKNNPPSN